MKNQIQNLKNENEKILKQNEKYRIVIKEEFETDNLDDIMEIKRKRKVYRRQNTEPNLFDDNDSKENDDRKILNLFDSFYNSSIIKEIFIHYFKINILCILNLFIE